MSIKEFIRQTAESERDNIRDIKIDAKAEKKELKFNPEEEILEADLKAMMAILESHRRRKAWWEFAWMLMWLNIIKPDRATKYKVDKKIWEEIKDSLFEKYRAHFYLDFFKQLMKIKVIDSEQAEKMQITKEIWETASADLKSIRNKFGVCVFAEFAMAMKIVNPEKMKNFKLDDKTWQEMRAKIEDNRLRRRWKQFLWQLAEVKIICPERAVEVKIKDKDWDRILEEFRSFVKPGNWSQFAELTAFMTISAAHKVEVTNNGLKITMRDPAEEYKEKQEPMPVRKKF